MTKEPTKTNDSDSIEPDAAMQPAPTVAPATTAKGIVREQIDPLAMRQSLERFRPMFCSVANAQLVPIRVELSTAAMWVLNHLDQVAPFRERIARLVEVNHEWIDNLEGIAMAALEVASQCKVKSKSPPEVLETYQEASLLRDNLRHQALALQRSKLLPRGAIGAVSGKRGYRNTAVDLSALGNLLRDNWHNIVGKTSISRDDIDRCSVLAQLLFRNSEDRKRRGSLPAHLALLKQQAYALLMLAFEELRRCITFLDRSAVDRVAPTPFQRRPGKRGLGRKKQEQLNLSPALESDVEAQSVNRQALSSQVPVAMDSALLEAATPHPPSSADNAPKDSQSD